MTRNIKSTNKTVPMTMACGQCGAQVTKGLLVEDEGPYKWRYFFCSPECEAVWRKTLDE
jgi:hypothetical protein